MTARKRDCSQIVQNSATFSSIFLRFRTAELNDVLFKVGWLGTLAILLDWSELRNICGRLTLHWMFHTSFLCYCPLTWSLKTQLLVKKSFFCFLANEKRDQCVAHDLHSPIRKSNYTNPTYAKKRRRKQDTYWYCKPWTLPIRIWFGSSLYSFLCTIFCSEQGFPLF